MNISHDCPIRVEISLLKNVVKKEGARLRTTPARAQILYERQLPFKRFLLACRSPSNNRHSAPVLAPSRFILPKGCGTFFSI